MLGNTITYFYCKRQAARKKQDSGKSRFTVELSPIWMLEVYKGRSKRCLIRVALPTRLRK